MMRPTLSLFLVLGLTTTAGAQLGPGARPPALLVHGHYCGPGNEAPLAPIDALDAACARHDACTPAGGLPSRACNTRLRRDAERISHDRRQPEDLRALAGLVAAGATLMAPPKVSLTPGF